MRYSNVIEADAENLLLQSVKRLRGLCFKLKFLGMAGAPDRLVLLPGGRFYFVELKREKGGKLEASQEVLFPLIEKLGFKVHILRGEAEVKIFVETYLERLL